MPASHDYMQSSTYYPSLRAPTATVIAAFTSTQPTIPHRRQRAQPLTCLTPLFFRPPHVVLKNNSPYPARRERPARPASACKHFVSHLSSTNGAGDLQCYLQTKHKLSSIKLYARNRRTTSTTSTSGRNASARAKTSRSSDVAQQARRPGGADRR
jgi:hypothetical protein